MANLLTAIRLLLVIPVVIAIINTQFIPDWLFLSLILLAIASDYFDGKVARALNTASARGQLFDHSTDFIFVTSALFAMSTTGLINLVLPVLITIAFFQYVFDSYFLFKQKHLRMSFLGRWNGVLYFVPVILIATSRLEIFHNLLHYFSVTISIIAYGLIVSTLASIIDRALAPRRLEGS